MTDHPTQRDLLFYIQESIVRIEQCAAGGEETFLCNPIIQDAILRRVETLADAASHLPDAEKSRHPAIRCRAIYGFQNIATHGNLGLDWVYSARVPIIHKIRARRSKVSHKRTVG